MLIVMLLLNRKGLNLVQHDGSQPSVTRKLLHTMTVQKLKMLLQRIFKVPRTQVEVRVVSSRVSYF